MTINFDMTVIQHSETDVLLDMGIDLEYENLEESVEAFVTKLYEKSDLNGDGFLDK